MILSSKQHKVVHFNLLMLFCFLLPLYPRLTTLVGFFLGVNWILSRKWIQNWKNFLNSLCLIFLGYYLLHVLGLLHTENLTQGVQEIETKFSLLFFPLLFFSYPLAKPQYEKLVQWFIICLLYTSPSPRDATLSRMPSSA